MNRTLVEMTVNGEPVRAEVEPRLHLGDFVRRELELTGTHLSCEHGVCGACTLLVDGQPQRACITLAVACDGARVTTIEGYGADPVMAALRRAFHEHHALQCGYCTPGMLCTARDIVLRLSGPDARRVRHELAGNLCRCTGYVGIVEAIEHVLALKAAGQLAMPAAAVEAQPAPITVAPLVVQGLPAPLATKAAPAAPAAEPGSSPAKTGWSPIDIAEDGEWVEVRQGLALPMPPADAWRQLTDLPRVAACLPGARVTRHQGDDAEGDMAVRFGPISADFSLRAQLRRDDAARQARLLAEGSDRRSATQVKVLLDYAVRAEAAAAQLDLRLRFRLAGPLAQFSRSGLVADYVAELTRLFGENLRRTLAAEAGGAAPSAPQVAPAPSAGPSLWRLLLARLRRLFGG